MKMHLEYMLLQGKHKEGVLESDVGLNLTSTDYKFFELGQVT